MSKAREHDRGCGACGQPPQLPKPKRSKKKGPLVPDVPGRARIIAIANQKGGVGKSTTAVSLGAALADIGYRVLVADLDPQGNASTGMGIRHDAREVTVYDVVVSEARDPGRIVPTPVERLHAVPATIDLAGAEIELVSQFSRESRLKKAIEPVSEGVYDFILLDCPAVVGVAHDQRPHRSRGAHRPIQCEYYALEGARAAASQRVSRPAEHQLGPSALGHRDDDVRRPYEVVRAGGG